MELASEFRYSSVTGESPLTILISQSGETADTLGGEQGSEEPRVKDLRYNQCGRLNDRQGSGRGVLYQCGS